MVRELDSGRLGCWAVVLAAVLIGPGCHSGLVYQARHLPPEFMAPRSVSMQRLDFSRLARTTGRSELLYPGDLADITVITGLEQQEPHPWPVRLGEDGVANVPLVGPVRLAGLELPQAERLIRDESIRRGTFVNPQVSCVMRQRRTNRITVMGAVEEPGLIELPPVQSDLMAAILSAGGLSKDANSLVEVRHPSLEAEARIVRIDLVEAAATGAADLRLEDGSVVVVSKKPLQMIHVMGLVNKPDKFEINPETEVRMLDALAMAGGRKLEIADKVRVIRLQPDTQEHVIIEASVKDAKAGGPSNLRLAPGDVVSVEETPATFVVGTVKEFIRFGFTAGIPF